MEELIKKLEEKGIVKSLHMTANVLGKAPKEAVEQVLNDAFEKNDELCELFSKHCYDLGMYALIKELDIKPDPDYKLNEAELLFVELLKKIL